MITRTPVVIYAESTPNPAAMKLVANTLLVPVGASVEYTNKAQAKDSLLASDLFLFPFVTNVFIAGNYVTITKNDTVQWEEVTQHLREFLKLFLAEGKPAVSVLPAQEVAIDTKFDQTQKVYTQHQAPTNEIEVKIVEVLEQYIRPAVEQDGGLIVFKSFKEGVVTVQMKGSCSGCPSSTMTLKAGIEGLLKRMVPEVTEVRSEAA